MKLVKIIAAVVLSLSLLTGTSFAAPAWQLPKSGKIFSSNDAKQAYVADYMGKFFAGKIPMTFEVPDKWTYEKFSINGVKVERLANPKQKKSARVAMQLHGGGYIGALSDWYRELAIKQAVLTDAREIFMVDYRIAPDYLYPAALEDAVTAYRELLNRKIDPKNIIVFGDSAGGNSWKDPRLSPIYADLKNLPPMLIQIGGYELFVDEGIELLKKATADELNVTLSVYAGMSHDFSVLLPDLDDSVKSFIEIRNFVNLYMTPRK